MIRRQLLGTALVIAFAAVASACQVSPVEPPQTPSASPSPSAQASGELTASADLAINPPAPVNVRGTATGDGEATLSWDPPPAVAMAHHYSDKVVGYRIYRRGPGEIELRPIAITTSRSYVDGPPRGRGRFEYAVTSIREHNVEGKKSSPTVSLQLP